MSTVEEDQDSIKDILKNSGAYEEGLNLEELKQIKSAVELSISAAETEDIERALMESEVEFLARSDVNALLSSTMIAGNASNDGASDEGIFIANRNHNLPVHDISPRQASPIQVTVQAMVHHPLDWSPSNGHCVQHKRTGSEHSTICELGPTQSKRLCIEDANTDVSSAGDADLMPSEDSGLSSSEMSSLSLLMASDSSVLSIGEMPSRLLISTSSAAISDGSRIDYDVIAVDGNNLS